MEGDAVNAAATGGGIVAKLGGKPDREEDGVATLCGRSLNRVRWRG
ncbi:hypothetical protein ACK323_18260 [Aeromonas enteropelogenes]